MWVLAFMSILVILSISAVAESADSQRKIKNHCKIHKWSNKKAHPDDPDDKSYLSCDACGYVLGGFYEERD